MAPLELPGDFCFRWRHVQLRVTEWAVQPLHLLVLPLRHLREDSCVELSVGSARQRVSALLN